MPRVRRRKTTTEETYTRWGSIKRASFVSYTRTTSFIKSKPFTAFFITLGLLFAFIVLGNLLNAPKKEPTKANPVKTVTVYNIGETPKATFQAKLEKSGVVKIVA